MIVAAFFISFKDYKEGVIENKYILALLVLGFVFQALRGNLFTSTFKVIGVFIFGAGVSAFLWFIGILPAGDSKLFTSLLLYFPLGYYSRGLVIDFLINIFLPVFLFLLPYLLFKSRGGEINRALKKSLSPYRIAMIFVILTGFAWFIYAPIKMLGIDIGYFGLIIFLFVGYEVLAKVSSGKVEIAFIVLAVLRIIIDYQNALTFNFLFNTGLIVIVFVFIRFFALSLSYKVSTEELDLEDLEPGMNLASGFEETEEGYRKIEMIRASLVGYLMERAEKHGLISGSLNEKDIRELRKLKESGQLGSEKVRVFEKQHFSTFIFSGYFLTLVLGTSFVGFLSLFI